MITFIQKFIPVLTLVLFLGFGVVNQVSAQSTTTVPTTTPTSTLSFPTAPNTGMGGEASANILILGMSGLLMVLGVLYLYRIRTNRE